jgi:hypothetical protein
MRRPDPNFLAAKPDSAVIGNPIDREPNLPQRTIQTLVFFGGLCQYGVCLNRRVGLFVLVMSGFCRVILCVTGMRMMMMMSDEQVFTRC